VQGAARCRAESRGGSTGSPGARWVERSEGEKERVGERENRGREGIGAGGGCLGEAGARAVRV
jgi:hypothetical protein